MIYFISLDTPTESCETFALEQDSLDKADVWCTLQAEMFDPFIYMFPILAIGFAICGFLEPKKP